VLNLFVAGVALGGLGAGEWSLDHALKLPFDPATFNSLTGLLIALVAGLGGARVLLAVCWRPEKKAAADA
jgi:putative oxidoreductase